MIKCFTPAKPPAAQETQEDKDLFQVLDIERQLQSVSGISEMLAFAGHFFTIDMTKAMTVCWRAKQLGFDHVHINPNCERGHGPAGMAHVIIGMSLQGLPNVELIQATRSCGPDIFYSWDVGTLEGGLVGLLRNLFDLDLDELPVDPTRRRKGDVPVS